MTTSTPTPTEEELPRELDDKERDFYQAYYLLQNQRQGQFETNRLVVSNFILAGSLVALGFAIGKDNPGGWVTISVLAAVVIVNVLAMVYATTSRYWVKMHQRRARYVLSRLAPELVAMQDRLKGTRRRDVLSDRSGDGSFFSNLLRSEKVQSCFHLVLVIVVALSAVLAWPR